MPGFLQSLMTGMSLHVQKFHSTVLQASWIKAHCWVPSPATSPARWDAPCPPCSVQWVSGVQLLRHLLVYLSTIYQKNEVRKINPVGKGILCEWLPQRWQGIFYESNFYLLCSAYKSISWPMWGP